MKSDILLTIVVPAFNIAQYIERSVISLGSALNNERVEILLINDGSTDDTLKNCLKLEQVYDNIEVISKTNGGLSDTRNVGNLRASGEYIYFFDGDDFFSDGTFNSLMESLDNLRPDLLCFGYSKVDDHDSVLSKHLLMQDDEGKTFELSFKKLVETIVGREDEPVAGYAWNKIFKHELIEEQKFHSINYEDMPFLFKVFEKKRISAVYLNQNIYNYVQRQSSITHSINEKNLADKLKSLDMVEHSLENLGVEEQIRKSNDQRSLIAILWVSSLNRRLKSASIGRSAENQLKRLFWSVLRNSKINIYFKCKMLFYMMYNKMLILKH